MHSTRKFFTGAPRLHAAPVETAPASPGLILVRAPGRRGAASNKPALPA